jgi:hypothetical protein
VKRPTKPPTIPDSSEMLERIEAFQAELHTWLSRQRFQPQTVLQAMATAKTAAERRRLLADAAHWQTVRRTLRAVCKATREVEAA